MIPTLPLAEAAGTGESWFTVALAALNMIQTVALAYLAADRLHTRGQNRADDDQRRRYAQRQPTRRRD